MRNLVNLKNKEQAELENKFPCVRELFSASEQSIYSHISISVFDHCLTPEEAKLLINDNGSSHNSEHDKKLHSFCVALSEFTTVLPLKRISRHKNKFRFRRLTSREGARKFLNPKPYHHPDSKRFAFALPSYDSIYFEGCDYTHHIYCKNFEKLDPILKLAKTHGLHTQNQSKI